MTSHYWTNSSFVKTDIWNTQIMMNLEETETLKMHRKLLKPQVEKRRRERMNRSLENLRTLLLQGPEHQMPSQRRVEKAEILEHTVLFLQTSMAQSKKTEGTEGRQFLDGFSTCLQRATRFLQEEGETRGLQSSLSTTLHQRLTRPRIPAAIPTPAEVRFSPGTKVPDLDQRKQKQKAVYTHGLRPVSHPYRVTLRQASPNVLHHHANTEVTSQPSSSPQATVRQRVWRPWP